MHIPGNNSACCSECIILICGRLWEFGFRANKAVTVRTGTLQAGLAQVDWSLTGPAPAALSGIYMWKFLVGVLCRNWFQP